MAPPYPQKMWLMGPLTPMRFEADVEDCIVTQGEMPKDLNGGFYRVGGAWKRPSRQGLVGPFTQDGMVQALTFREGRVDFKNRWIRTPKYLAEDRAGEALFDWTDGAFDDWRAFGWGEVIRNELTNGVPQGTNNVNVVPFAGQLLTLGEQGSPPVALDPITLETRGSSRGRCADAGMHAPGCFGDAAFTAHPKWDPRHRRAVRLGLPRQGAVRHPALGQARRIGRRRDPRRRALRRAHSRHVADRGLRRRCRSSRWYVTGSTRSRRARRSTAGSRTFQWCSP